MNPICRGVAIATIGNERSSATDARIGKVDRHTTMQAIARHRADASRDNIGDAFALRGYVSEAVAAKRVSSKRVTSKCVSVEAVSREGYDRDA